MLVYYANNLKKIGHKCLMVKPNPACFDLLLNQPILPPLSVNDILFIDIFQVVELLLEDRNKLVDLISEMMERASGEKLLRKDGTQDPSVIDR